LEIKYEKDQINDYLTALQVAAEEGHLEIVDKLIKLRASIEEDELKYGKTALINGVDENIEYKEPRGWIA